MKNIDKGTPVLVTTEHRGVFFGYFDEAFEGGKHIALDNARNCIYWSADVKGFLGLANSGPSKNCKIGPPVDIPQLRDVTCVAKVTQEAVKKWEEAPWS